jgi:hypothetical protein
MRAFGPQLNLSVSQSLAEVKMGKKKYELSRVSGMPVSDEELLDDLRNVATQLGKNTVGQKEYRKTGKYDDTTPTRRFGSWNKALIKAGLIISNEINISDNKLFENILELWTYYGRQPRRSELSLSPSRISQSPYLRRFGGWRNALEAFIAYMDSSQENVVERTCEIYLENRGSTGTKKTSRDINLRLRFQILKRDHFRCVCCGTVSGPELELHVDHIVPYSKGGETTRDNLQTLCSKCNFGKSNIV